MREYTRARAANGAWDVFRVRVSGKASKMEKEAAVGTKQYVLD
jgi:hypothetical protein